MVHVKHPQPRTAGRVGDAVAVPRPQDVGTQRVDRAPVNSDTHDPPGGVSRYARCAGYSIGEGLRIPVVE